MMRISSGSYMPDVILTDINLPGMSGIGAVGKLRGENFCGAVIFITASPDYALDVREAGAAQYILSMKVFAVLTNILLHRKYIVVRHKKALRKITFIDILYAETRGEYQVIITRSEELAVRITACEMRK